MKPRTVKWIIVLTALIDLLGCLYLAGINWRYDGAVDVTLIAWTVTLPIIGAINIWRALKRTGPEPRTPTVRGSIVFLEVSMLDGAIAYHNEGAV